MALLCTRHLVRRSGKGLMAISVGSPAMTTQAFTLPHMQQPLDAIKAKQSLNNLETCSVGYTVVLNWQRLWEWCSSSRH
jgi:hypothetical protein